ncbi:MAG: hypothetical protein H0T84_08300 [Tatlockia sp.]|nr:hypothetical protein [Tatlockia sp.]
MREKDGFFNTKQNGSSNNAAITAAKDCLREIERRFPLGGINILSNVSKFPNVNALKDEVKLIESLGRTPILNSKLPKELKAAFCDHLARYSLQYIQQKFPDINVELVACDAHVFLVINRALDSNPIDMATWGKDSLLFDPWAKLIIAPHLDRGFSKKELLNLSEISYCEDFSTGELSNNHFMAGVGKIDLLSTLQVCALSENTSLEKRLKPIYSNYINSFYKYKNEIIAPDIDCCLRRAAYKGNLEHIGILCALGADIFAQSESNQFTALDWAKKAAHLQCAIFLQEQMNEKSLGNNSTYS